MRKMKKSSWILLFTAVLSVLAVFFCSRFSSVEPTPYYQAQVAAAVRAQHSFDAVKAFKQQQNIPLASEDFLQTGMLGAPFNSITTTLGAPEAKRTAATAEMAALAVRLFCEAGLKKGDRVGAVFSGSFPAINLAVIAACEELGLELRYIASVGASTFGANNPELTFPDMAVLLFSEGKIQTLPLFVTFGGDGDTGENMDAQLLLEIEQRLAKQGILMVRQPDFAENLQFRRQQLEAEGALDCFVGVGGNIATLGRNESAQALGQGLLRQPFFAQAHAEDGLLAIYRSEGIAAINFLNIKKLALDYGIEFDPATLPKTGEGNVYYAVRYQKLPVLACVLILLGMLWFYRKTVRHEQMG